MMRTQERNHSFQSPVSCGITGIHLYRHGRHVGAGRRDGCSCCRAREPHPHFRRTPRSVPSLPLPPSLPPPVTSSPLDHPSLETALPRRNSIHLSAASLLVTVHRIMSSDQIVTRLIRPIREIREEKSCRYFEFLDEVSGVGRRDDKAPLDWLDEAVVYSFVYEGQERVVVAVDIEQAHLPCQEEHALTLCLPEYYQISA
ncbi:hypothetical protein BHE74_00057755 [Ensete ventricosum]|nr:hypothetical protein BHE74_00057755 [Ensete ventricosum]